MKLSRLKRSKSKQWLKSWEIIKTLDRKNDVFEWTDKKENAYVFQSDEQINYVIEKLQHQNIVGTIERIKDKKREQINPMLVLEPSLIMKLSSLNIPPDLNTNDQREFISVVLRREINKLYPDTINSKQKFNNIVKLSHMCWKNLHT